MSRAVDMLDIAEKQRTSKTEAETQRVSYTWAKRELSILKVVTWAGLKTVKPRGSKYPVMGYLGFG